MLMKRFSDQIVISWPKYMSFLLKWKRKFFFANYILQLAVVLLIYITVVIYIIGENFSLTVNREYFFSSDFFCFFSSLIYFFLFLHSILHRAYSIFFGFLKFQFLQRLCLSFPICFPFPHLSPFLCVIHFNSLFLIRLIIAHRSHSNTSFSFFFGSQNVGVFIVVRGCFIVYIHTMEKQIFVVR